MGDFQPFPDIMSTLIRNIRDDLATYGGDWTAQGFWAEKRSTHSSLRFESLS